MSSFVSAKRDPDHRALPPENLTRAPLSWLEPSPPALRRRESSFLVILSISVSSSIWRTADSVFLRHSDYHESPVSLSLC